MNHVEGVGTTEDGKTKTWKYTKYKGANMQECEMSNKLAFLHETFYC